MNFCSHTLVRQGMPFISLVLRQVIPYANRCLITISEKSDSETQKSIILLRKEFPGKIEVEFENVAKPGDLTFERQKQVARTTEDWILFLDDDDYWPRSSIVKMLSLLDSGFDAFAINPFQVIDQNSHDSSWRYRWFTKWLRNQPGLTYKGAWPKDLPYLNDKILFHRKNKMVKALPDIKFFHLSNIKNHSFRNEEWAKGFKKNIGGPIKIPDQFKKEMKRIYEAES